MRAAYVTGVGMSRFGRQASVPVTALVEDAVREALNDAGVDGVDAVFFGSVYGEMGVAQHTLKRLGITGIPIVRLESACATAAVAFHEAVRSVESGRFRRVLAVGAEQMTARFSGPIDPGEQDDEARIGLLLPAIYALSATRYMACHGLTSDELAGVAVKNRANAIDNSRADLQSRVTVDDVLESRMICEPLTLFQCSRICDGSAAAVIEHSESSSDIRVLGSASLAGEIRDHTSSRVWGYDLVRATAEAAMREAGINACSEIDLFEVHDAFTIGEIVAIEAIGVAKEGSGGRFVASGGASLDGESPVNASGGLLARGHPIGATGLAQVYEVVCQLRGSAGLRQINDAAVGLTESIGGGVSGIDGNACVVSILGG